MPVSICSAHVSLAGILKYQRLPFSFFALTFAAEVDVKKVPTSAAHTLQSEELLAGLCWHTGGGSQTLPAGTFFRVPFRTSGPVFGHVVLGTLTILSPL